MAKGNPGPQSGGGGGGRGGEAKAAKDSKSGHMQPHNNSHHARTGGGGRGKKAAPAHNHREAEEQLASQYAADDTKGTTTQSGGGPDGGAPPPHSSETPQTKKMEHPKVQPTSEQMMIAQIIRDNADEIEAQKRKIQQVIDITGREEDEVATALFDAGWDQNRAVELLLEGGMSAWEETGKKKKKKQPAEDHHKDDWDESGENGAQERDRNARQRGPPRLRRGGREGRGGSRGGRDRGEGGDRHHDFHHNDAFDGASGAGGGNFRGGRRGDQPPRRGGRGGRGGGGAGSGPGRSSYQSNGPAAGSVAVNATGGGLGNIDTWNPAGGGGGTGGSGGAVGPSGNSAPSVGSSGKPGGSNKDAFDNAGNWGDDFPPAEDWDNEEYTGSLADTKVFTASSSANTAPHKGAKGGSGGPKAPGGQSRTFSAALDPNSNPALAPGATNNGGPPNVSATPGLTGSASSYSQPIDLTTILQKPTTQSSINSTQPSLLQFSHQAATDSLKAAVGIGAPVAPGGGAPSAKTVSGDLNYSAYPPNPASGSYGGSAFSSIKPSPNGGVGKGGVPSGPRSRVPPPSKIPSSAVEMPGDSLTQLDVQFGALDMQNVKGPMGGSDPSNSGFEFNGSDSDKYMDPKSGSNKPSGHDFMGAPPSAKEVNKTLSNVISGGKLNPSEGGGGVVSGYASVASNDRQPPSATGGPPVSSTYNVSRGGPVAQATGSGLEAKPGNDASLSGYANYANTYQQHQSQKSSSGHPYGSSSASSGYGASQQPTGYGGHQYSQGGNSNASSYTNGGGASYPSQQATGYGGQQQQQQQQQQHRHGDVQLLGLTTTTNALSSKVSATSASKVSMPNLPPGVAGMTMPPQYMHMGNHPNMPYFGLQQPGGTPIFSPYTGLEDLAALQHRNAAASLHSLSNTGYFDPTNGHYVGSSLTSSRSDNASTNVGNNSNPNLSSFADKSFGNVVAASDSTSSPIPSTLQSAVASQSAAVAAAAQQQQQQSFSLATNAFAQSQTLPPGYAYFYGQMPGMQPYGSGMYPPNAAALAGVPTTTTQFQQKGFGSNYSYDALGQGNKDFSNAYGGGNPSGGKGGNSGSGGNNGGKNGQYWGNNSLSTQLW
ncbi:LOW QUALITY PROTEIN: protein lingerer-like [Tigriopus californicus]|uniref:LOW QUALITY PROTEIN: protein lingerer-like n=1 Tax=Tigriopus californicus TaxID=6832 RepID=UPI0027DA8D6F|nr:LOW QUALITY PROTEIN: protein lingerer-like [Tigriopus californicus]